MSRDLRTFSLRLAAALGTAACSSAYALHSTNQGAPLAAMPAAPQRSPYDVELIGPEGRPLATYDSGGRFYVLGEAGDRYSIRVTNPTGRRVEALISVDGLDVIDGEAADFVNKRGYVVPAGGDLVVDGFRMSATQVAAFRFSPVGDSYAELKGKGRNVGVIGVAIFEERQEPEMVIPQPEARPLPIPDRWYGRAGKADAGEETGGKAPGDRAAHAGRAPSPSAPPADVRSEASASRQADTPASSGEPAAPAGRLDDDRGGGRELCCGPGPVRKKSRPGLGTAWGEERYSAVDFTRFERAHPTVPTAMAELRYNDAQGLRALGIAVQPVPDADELWQRETADPFPAARGFATPPR